jgi:hypothetical protein
MKVPGKAVAGKQEKGRCNLTPVGIRIERYREDWL